MATAEDFGSTMIEENVVFASGNKFILNAEEFERLISDAGYPPPTMDHAVRVDLKIARPALS